MGPISRRRGSTDDNPWPGYPERDTQHRDNEARIQALVDGCVVGRPQAGAGDGWTVTAEVIEVRGNRGWGKSPAQLAFPDPPQPASRPRSGQGQGARTSRAASAAVSTESGPPTPHAANHAT